VSETPDYCHCRRRDNLDTAVCFGTGFGCPYCGRDIDPAENNAPKPEPESERLRREGHGACQYCHGTRKSLGSAADFSFHGGVRDCGWPGHLYIDALADALAEKERKYKLLAAHAEEAVSTLERENASLLKRADEMKQTIVDQTLLQKKLGDAETITKNLNEIVSRMGRINDELRKRAEAVERLHDQHCPLLHLQASSPQRCMPPWRKQP
jgi:hypothetical protein